MQEINIIGQQTLCNFCVPLDFRMDEWSIASHLLRCLIVFFYQTDLKLIPMDVEFHVVTSPLQKGEVAHALPSRPTLHLHHSVKWRNFCPSYKKHDTYSCNIISKICSLQSCKMQLLSIAFNNADSICPSSGGWLKSIYYHRCPFCI